MTEVENAKALFRATREYLDDRTEARWNRVEEAFAQVQMDRLAEPDATDAEPEQGELESAEE